jgi:hypothetical protein
VKPAKFGLWLQQALLFIGRDLVTWFGFALFIAIIQAIGKFSPAVGIFSSVTLLFVGVGVAKYIDLKHSDESPVGFFWAIQKSLPLAMIAGLGVDLFWFVFTTLANILSGDFDKILMFFFNWELSPAFLKRGTVHEIASWIYTYADMALILSLLLLITFGSWFSYPFMLFNNYTWTEAKKQGDWITAKNRSAIYYMLGFIFLNAVLFSGLMPLFTPVLYMLVSTLMYISYKDRLPKTRS